MWHWLLFSKGKKDPNSKYSLISYYSFYLCGIGFKKSNNTARLFWKQTQIIMKCGTFLEKKNESMNQISFVFEENKKISTTMLGSSGWLLGLFISDLYKFKTLNKLHCPLEGAIAMHLDWLVFLEYELMLWQLCITGPNFLELLSQI